MLFIFAVSIAQEDNISSLLAQAEDVLYSDPQEAIRIAEYISEKSNSQADLFKATYLLTRGYYMQGRYNLALKKGLQSADVNWNGADETQIELNILLSKILKELEIGSLANYYSIQALDLSDRNSDTKIKNWVKGKTIQYSLNTAQIDSSDANFGRIYKAKALLQNQMANDDGQQIGNIDLDLAEMHLQHAQLDSARNYLLSAFRQSEKKKPGNYLQMKALLKYGDFLHQKNEHARAIDTLKVAMKLAEKFPNLSEQITIANAIAKNYLEIKNLEAFNEFKQLADELNNTRGDFEHESVNTAYNIFNENENQRLDALRSKNRFQLLVLGAGLLLLLLILGLTALRYRAKIGQYRKFIGYLEKRKEPVTAPAPFKPEAVKTLNVPKEAEQQLLTKLDDFEQSLNFTNKDISLSRMALQFETNTKYLSEIINTHKQKNFNSYINELRINFIIQKLENDPQYLQYKISYLAEESGFSSHSVFATVFKSVTGISPTTFITLLRDKQENALAI
ncbi:helix-turn-helix domain-containing protein [Aequorivita sp. SDUM287046]|uniref:Helix-turn-helix domain-containing protein n=1 Tax=Aequorivita aurantiaca TaxID=3053356 RepID=A0ABT8DL09_9FLAO|nr:helix-turn-helix domain-containing protein [Aequorivita aurantiaca]MDN3724684.1 helix-turn-helix domain-containing protein [Aequorivita aurantiaca]